MDVSPLQDLLEGVPLQGGILLSTKNLDKIIELTPEEASQIEGGDYLKAAALMIGCFGAGFRFGFHTLGPLLIR